MRKPEAAAEKRGRKKCTLDTRKWTLRFVRDSEVPDRVWLLCVCVRVCSGGRPLHMSVSEANSLLACALIGGARGVLPLPFRSQMRWRTLVGGDAVILPVPSRGSDKRGQTEMVGASRNSGRMGQNACTLSEPKPIFV